MRWNHSPTILPVILYPLEGSFIAFSLYDFRLVVERSLTALVADYKATSHFFDEIQSLRYRVATNGINWEGIAETLLQK